MTVSIRMAPFLCILILILDATHLKFPCIYILNKIDEAGKIIFLIVIHAHVAAIGA